LQERLVGFDSKEETLKLQEKQEVGTRKKRRMTQKEKKNKWWYIKNEEREYDL
jgi:hypothetical protein